jgi:class 3 adenylate cyclase/tetratricopeptide (TPR) repeat protein
VHCSICGCENPDAAKFCHECSAPLVLQCTACGEANRRPAKFCGQCGVPLENIPLLPVSKPTSPSERIEPARRPDPAIAKGERRHLTVLFCDLVGSTGMAGNLDPEDWREVIGIYHDGATEAVERFGGYVAQLLGDGLLVYFGYPQAHEDDPQRAVLAGLAILDGMAALNERIAGKALPRLAVRIGIHSGSVVVDESTSKSAKVYSDVPNIASRVETAAGPDTVLISGAVHHLVSGLFVVEDCGAQPLKGVEVPIRLYRVIQPSGARGRLAAAAVRGLTPFIGREDELRLLLNRWDQVREGEGQFILVVGEAGIGKSRLVQRFHEQLTDTPHTWFECAAAALHQNTPFYTVSELLEQIFQGRREQTSEERIAGLEASLKSAGVKLDEALPLIARLANLPIPDRYPPLQMPPDQQRKRLLATITAWALGNARIQPMVIVVEDLHWADPSTLEVIQVLVEQDAMARLLMISTARPEFRAPWPLRAHHAQLTLNRLNTRNAHEMVAQLAADRALSPNTVEAVVERSGGIPLFVEELTRAVAVSKDSKPALSEIPATLRDLLMARLDRLGEAREVAQVAAILGHEFSWEMLSAIAPVEDGQLATALKTLAEAGLLLEQGLPPEARYRFRHVLIQETAYRSLLRTKRQSFHRRIAEVMEKRFPETAEAQPQLLAFHLTEAGLGQQAIPHWQKGAQKAAERSANPEAISHLTKALELLKTLPESPSRAQQELGLQIALGVSLMPTKGYAAPEVETVYSRVRELYNEVGESPQFFPMLFGLWQFYAVRAEYNTARELGEQLISLARSAQDPALLIEAHVARGNTLSFLGELVLAREHLEHAIALYDPQKYRSHAFVYAQDPGVHSLSYATLVLWLLGYPDRARKRSLEAFALAQELSHPYSSAFALVHVLYVHRFSRDVKATEERARELAALSTEHGFPITLAAGAAHLGWALAEQGLGEEGIVQIRQAIDTWRATGSTLFYQPFLLAMLAEAYGKVGLSDDGLTVLAEALAIADNTGERFWEAELYRLKGELTLQSQFQGSKFKVRDEVEGCFRKAIDVARRQSAKSLELRAVMSLSRLWWHHGNRSEARRTLAEIYGWFTEGFDTADLKEARTLLKDAFRE